MKQSKRVNNKLAKIRIYNESDFKGASRLEKLHMYMMEPDRHYLAEKHLNYLDELKQIFHILSKELSLSRAVPKIMEALTDPGSRARVYRMINDTKELFGSMIKKNKEFDRMVLKERYLHLIRQAQSNFNKDKDPRFLETIRLTYQAIDRLDGLSDHDNQELDPNSFDFPDLIVSTDPKYLDPTAVDEQE